MNRKDASIVSQAPRFKIPGITFVWASVLIFGASNSIVQLLTRLGTEHPVEGRNAISFCNVLFVGNLCALVVLALIYRREWSREHLRTLRPGDWLALTLLAVLAGAVVPALAFLALEKTSVTNVVLLGRIEPAVFLALAVLVLGERPTPWSVAGIALALIGAITTFALEAGGFSIRFGTGEWQVVAASVISATASIISKKWLTRVPIGVFAVFRTGVGTVFFFVAAIYLFGSGHFRDAFSPLLWQWMLIYGGIIVAMGQYGWAVGLKRSDGQDIVLATSFSPIAGVLFAFLLLGERPTMPVVAGVSLILAGIAVAQAGNRWQAKRVRRAEPVETSAIVIEGHVNFKGV